MFVAFIFLAMGIGLLYVPYKMVKLLLYFRKLRKNGTKTRGTITDVEITEGEDDKIYFPIVRFRTYGGVEIVGKTMSGYKEKDYQSSVKEVEVIYLESNPEKFIIERQKFNYWILVVFVITIIVFLYTVKIIADQNPYWVNDFKQFLDKLF